MLIYTHVTVRRMDLILLAALLAPLVLCPAPASPQTFPGGFIEPSSSTAVRPRLTKSQIQAFLPNRGKFTFPTPYNTQGIRLTNGSDCGSKDCVNSVGYSYWRNMNNHVGSDSMLIFLVLDRVRGGEGPTLFRYNKVTDQVTKLGPLFDPASDFSWMTGEGWYFSATQPTTLYIHDLIQLYRFDVLTKQRSTVLDIRSAAARAVVGNNRHIWQIHSSNDDMVHSMTVKSSNYADLGCLVYQELTGTFVWVPSKKIDYNECQIDKSGRWLMVMEDIDGGPGAEDMRIIDLQGVYPERVVLDPDGAVGHYESGYGYLVGVDNWNDLPNAWQLWREEQDPLQGTLQSHNNDWLVEAPAHISHANARADVSVDQQYVCGSSTQQRNTARANEVICFRLDGSLQILVVAPVMTKLNAKGGGDEYSKLPKGNIDVTGKYFIWTDNMASGRLDAFIVKVPSQLLFP